jgi:DNA-binding transcriptional regulator YiaG
MTPAKFRAIRHAFRYSAEGLARALRVQSGRTVRKWEAGARDIPGPAQVVMRLLEKQKITPDDLANL